MAPGRYLPGQNRLSDQAMMLLRLPAALIALVGFAAMPAVLSAQGGPPLLTGDPGTPGDGHSEFNIALTVERFRQQTLYEAPLLDFNYGVGERIQLKVELPWLFRNDNPEQDESG